MPGLSIDIVRKLCSNRCIVWSVHSLERLQERNISRRDVINTIMTGSIIEQYEDSFPYPACLVMGLSVEKRLMHVVCGCNGEYVSIVTAYYPTADKFKNDGKTRKEKKQ